MKNLLLNILSVDWFVFKANSVIKSPQEKCVEAHMRVWETPWKEEGSKKKKNIWKKVETTKYKFLYQKEYYEFIR